MVKAAGTCAPTMEQARYIIGPKDASAATA